MSITSTTFICGVATIAAVIAIKAAIVVVVLTITNYYRKLTNCPFSEELLAFGGRKRRSLGSMVSSSSTTLIVPITVLINLFGYFVNLFGYS